MPRKDRRYERYELENSLWAQDPTQRDIATLLRLTKDQLKAVIRDKEQYISRRTVLINGKSRNLAVPLKKLRQIHSRIKFQLNKIRQPIYLFSPRKGYGQRDNAERHANGTQLLKVDIKQFYPQTTQEDIWRWAYYSLGIREDVAGLIAKLVAIDGKMPFGSPISPVLTSLVHRPMFDQVHSICQASGLTMTLWVDDLTISGNAIAGDVIVSVRDAIRDGGFQTHRIEKLNSARPIIITGVPVANGRVQAPRSLHKRIEAEYLALRSAETDSERAGIIDRILSVLGTYRYHVGASTSEGRRTADRMHALKQRRSKLPISIVTPIKSPDPLSVRASVSEPDDTAPWE